MRLIRNPAGEWVIMVSVFSWLLLYRSTVSSHLALLSPLVFLPSPLFQASRLSCSLSELKGTSKCLGSPDVLWQHQTLVSLGLLLPGGNRPHKFRTVSNRQFQSSPSVGWGAAIENNIRQHISSLDSAKKENTIKIFPFVEMKNDQLRAVNWWSIWADPTGWFLSSGIRGCTVLDLRLGP